jgi:hypothetical protein
MPDVVDMIKKVLIDFVEFYQEQDRVVRWSVHGREGDKTIAFTLILFSPNGDKASGLVTANAPETAGGDFLFKVYYKNENIDNVILYENGGLDDYEIIEAVGALLYKMDHR